MSEEQASSPSAKMGDEEKPVSGLSGSRRPGLLYPCCPSWGEGGEEEPRARGGGTLGRVRAPFGEEWQIQKAGRGLADLLRVHPLFVDEDAECLAQSHTTN